MTNKPWLSRNRESFFFSGLAILAGVSQKALSALEKTLTIKAPSKSLEAFISKPLTLTIENVTVNGKDPGNLKIYRASYCAAVLKHYASEPRSNPVAIATSLFFKKGVDKMGLQRYRKLIKAKIRNLEALKEQHGQSADIEKINDLLDENIRLTDLIKEELIKLKN